MLNKLACSKNRVVGFKQTRKAIQEGRAKVVFLAKDVEKNLLEKIEELCKINNVELIYITTMKELGKACNIDVKAACAALIYDK
ncbi:ribosomal L7Ae/L30e/S12e/Gadd45 family protein [Garciella nitratireducens]|uniref:ribosomal L7Ae/L30e/S12e/Gadd45 family protein n=1 Tax=Garciella nitratireducens TaxID=218205 RepID=UPI000DE9897C|nr:ribosomal L7Ae/L30e/S12e/Gadd45 family protein [Garciella nitratireducens]RBP44873.1 LSU ribosomal protein L7AE [Garciella nitratireducens]